MAYTMQNVIDHARIPLNDSAKERYSDDTLLSYANDAVLIVRKRRPDLFLGQWSSLPSNLSVTDAFPVDDEYFPTFADYVTGRAELVDDENVDSSRAKMLIESFIGGITS
jgi:hypothetical protein